MENIMIANLNNVKTYSEVPDTAEYFQEITISETLELPNEYLGLGRILSSYVKPKILSTKIISTPKCISCEGQNLSGYKLIVEIGIEQSFKYIACQSNYTMHAFIRNEVKKSVYIVVPTKYKGVDVASIVRANRCTVIPYISDIYCKALNTREIFSSISLLVDFKFLK